MGRPCKQIQLIPNASSEAEKTIVWIKFAFHLRETTNSCLDVRDHPIRILILWIPLLFALAAG